MITDYAEVQRYTQALPPALRAGLYLDGAYAYLEVHESETALSLIAQAQALLTGADDYEARLTAARALLLAAEARLRLGTDLEQATSEFREAARRYAALGNPSKVAVAMTLAGMTYAAQGDTTRALMRIKG